MEVITREPRANAIFLRLPRSGNHHDLGLFGIGAGLTHFEYFVLALLSEAAWALVVATAPGHVNEVRQRVFDALSPREVAQLERIAGRIAACVDDRAD